MIQHTFGLLTRPSAQWRAVAELPEDSFRTLLLYPCFLAILPAVAWYYGTSRVGWTVGDQGEAIKLTAESARQITVLFYLAMLGSVAVIGYFVHWMSDTYGANSSLTKGIVIVGPDLHSAVHRRAGRFLPTAVDRPADRRRGGELVRVPAVPGHSHRHGHSRGARLPVLQRGGRRGACHPDLHDGRLGNPLGVRRGAGVYGLIHRLYITEFCCYEILNWN